MRISDWSSDVCSSDLGRLDASELEPMTFLPVSLARHEEPDAESTSTSPRRAGRRRATTGSRVEIVLANGRVLRVDVGIEARSEERRGGKEGVRTWRYRLRPDH